jgi:hypothetical protein
MELMGSATWKVKLRGKQRATRAASEFQLRSETALRAGTKQLRNSLLRMGFLEAVRVTLFESLFPSL